jgi:hypothetical protein
MGRKALQFALAALLLLPLAAVAQSPVSLFGNFQDISGNVTTGLQVQFLLAGCGGNLPRITGHFNLVNTQYNFTPDATGTLQFVQIWPNDVITCGLVTGSTQYLMTILVNNIPQGPATCFQILSTESPFNLNSQTPCNVTSVPPPPTPPLDAVFHNLNVTGFFSGISGSMSGSFTAGSYAFASAAPETCPSGDYSTGLNINFGPTCFPLPTPATVVTSFNGRQNVVTPATGDYTCAMVTGSICSIPSFTVFGRTSPVTAETGDYTCAQVTGAFCGTAPTLAQELVITSGICTTSGAETACTINSGIPINWPTAFADTSYSVVCSYLGAPTGTGTHPGLYGPYITSKTPSSITIAIQSGSASAAGDNTIPEIDCHGQSTH